MPARSFIEVSFAPSLQLVSKVREFTSDFYLQSIGDPELLSRLEIATHEMLENAVKHSGEQPTRVRIECHPEPGGPRLVVKTWNQPSEEAYQELRGLVAAMETAGDPDAYYQQLMAQAARREDGSGLGLGRIWVEARMNVRCTREGPMVCVSAETIAAPAQVSA